MLIKPHERNNTTHMAAQPSSYSKCLAPTSAAVAKRAVGEPGALRPSQYRRFLFSHTGAKFRPSQLPALNVKFAEGFTDKRGTHHTYFTTEKMKRYGQVARAHAAVMHTIKPTFYFFSIPPCLLCQILCSLLQKIPNAVVLFFRCKLCSSVPKFSDVVQWHTHLHQVPNSCFVVHRNSMMQESSFT